MTSGEKSPILWMYETNPTNQIGVQVTMSVEVRSESRTCGCCNGNIPAGTIRWRDGGECSGCCNLDGTCGAIAWIEYDTESTDEE